LRSTEVPAAGGQTTLPGSPTAPKTEAGYLTATPGGQAAHGTEAGGSTFTLGGLTAHPHVTPLTPASSTSTVTYTAPSTSVVPLVAPMTPSVPPAVSRRPRATWEPPTLPLHQQTPPAKVVLVPPQVNPHPMTT
jgi:hypothetical protein